MKKPPPPLLDAIGKAADKPNPNAAEMLVHDSFTFPGNLREQAAKLNLACGTSGLFFVKKNADKVFHMKIQDILGAFLSAHGKHAEAAEAFESDTRATWDRLADEAIRSAPESERTHVAHTVKLALDAPENGGPGLAVDFEIRPEARKLLVLEGGAPAENIRPVYRAWQVSKDGSKVTDAGLASEDIDNLRRRIVGLYVAREIKVVK